MSIIQKKHNIKDNLVNRDIKAEYVLLVDEENNTKENMPFFVAFKRAKEAGLDLVQVSPEDSKVAICKIMDYKKYIYDKKKKQQLIKKNQKVVLTKEMQFRLNTDVHDYQTKLNHVKRFLSKEDKVKVIIFFRGRETDRNENAIALLEKIEKELIDVAKRDSTIQEGKRTMFLIFAPLKGGKSSGVKTEQETV